MAESSQIEMQGEATQIFFDVCALPATCIFEDISYASPGMPEKPKWVNTRASKKQKNHKDQSQIKEEWDKIHDPILAKNPKTLREVAYERMKKISDPNSLAQKQWFSRLPQYMVSFVHYFLELVDEAINHFNPDTNTIKGRELRVNIFKEAIGNILCIPEQSSKVDKMESFNPAKGLKIWKSKDFALDFYNKETQRPREDHKKPPQILEVHNAFPTNLQDSFSMVAFVCGLDTDRYVQDFQLGLGFQLRRKHSFFWYDFAKFIIKEMLRQIRDYKMQQRFKFPSFFAHMFLHQNPYFFKKHVRLAIFDEKGRRRHVSVWILSSPQLMIIMHFQIIS